MNSKAVIKQWTYQFPILNSIIIYSLFGGLSLYLSTRTPGLDIWYASMAFGLLLSQHSYLHWSKHCAAILGTNILLYLNVAPLSLHLVTSSVVHVFEAIIIAVLMKQATSKKSNHQSIFAFTVVLFNVLLLPALLGAIVKAVLGLNFSTQALLTVLTGTFLSSIVGAISVFPIGYYLYTSKQSDWVKHDVSITGVIALIAFTAVVNIFALIYMPYPYAYTSLALVLSTLFMPFSGVALNILINSIVSVLFVSFGIVTLMPGKQSELLFLLPMLFTYLTPILLAITINKYKLAHNKFTSANDTIQRMYDYTPVAMLSIDNKGIINAVSEQWLSLLGYPREAVVGRRAIDFLTPASRDYATNYVLPEFFKLGKVERIRYQMHHYDGHIIDVELTSVMEPESLRRGKYFNSLAVIKDVTTEITLTKRLAQERELLETTLMSIGDGVVATDVNGLTRFVNPIAESLLGVRASEALNKPAEHYIHLIDRHDSTRLPCPIRQVLDSREMYTFEQDAILVSKSGVQYSIQDKTTPIVTSKGELQGVVMVFQDVTELVASNDRMAYLAQHDALTGLPNRTLALDRLYQACSKHARVPQKFAVAFVDVDNFKHINDSFGHDCGDVVLQTLGKKLNTILRSSDTAARLGGDEFLLLLHDVTDRQAISQIYEKLNKAVSAPIIVNKQSVSVSISIGVCVFPDDGIEPDVLLKRADEAMYQAKSHGRNRLSFYSQTTITNALEHVQLTELLSENNLYSQDMFAITPLIRAVDHNIQGVVIEYDCSRVMPEFKGVDVFALARQQAVFAQISKQWFEGVTHILSRLPIHGVRDIVVRIHDEQVLSDEFYHGVKLSIEELNIHPSKLVLSFQESVLCHGSKPVVDAISRLKALGLRLDVSEFGVHSISLDFLNVLPLDSVTIGRGLTSQMEAEQHNETLTYSLVKLAKSLKLTCCAMTVSTSYQATLLEAMGCDHLLGDYFYKTMDIEQLNVLVDTPQNVMLVSSNQ
ncbi:hypothetical protein CWB96_14070 [Pseudoalteromonas citrea]|uniref:Diguanylate phosphodiesterase n=1 Tax=Pseudoalteromonas citrea TaxID=43655 RepID=A0A5S3XM91_9GAMM|nr:diguanylate cyclase [Pseudoalteromonas citrea]TMP45929.1 hypothetical protein CWB97_02800 [Pseudoalteromonas citrea]TMP57097.1 hypothetical protein CWB96_14070 [Pseudoalteromonas citrea]